MPDTYLLTSSKNGRCGILIEESEWDGAASYDDSFAIYSRAQRMVAVDRNTMTITPTFLSKEFFLWKPGDWASVWSPGQEELRGMARVIDVDGKTGDQTFHVTLEAMPAGASEGDIVLHEESLNRGSVIRNCRTSDIGSENSSTRFRCVDVTFENNHLDDFHFWFHAGSNGPRPRDIVLRNNYVSDERMEKVTFQQGLNCLIIGNELDGVMLDFQKGEDMRVIGNRWSGMRDDQMSVKASKGSTVFLDGNNQRSGEVLDKWVETDGHSAVK